MKKKSWKILIVLSLIVSLVFTSYRGVEAASSYMGGPDTVHPGDTITVSLVVTASGKYGVQGNFSYDSSVLTLTRLSSGISGWMCENGGGTLIAYDNNMSNPINGSATVMIATFKVSDSASAGANCSVSVTGIVTTDGSASESAGSASYNKTVTANAPKPDNNTDGGGSSSGSSDTSSNNQPSDNSSSGGSASNDSSSNNASSDNNGTPAADLSGENGLNSLEVKGNTLTPGFSDSVQEYKIEDVEYDVTALDIAASTKDDKATVTVSGNQLEVGENIVTVTVKAENGSEKVYKIIKLLEHNCFNSFICGTMLLDFIQRG